MRIAGIMSGTSLDGIDVAIVDIQGKQIKTVVTQTRPYPNQVRHAILAASTAATSTATLSRLNFLLGELYASAVEETCRKHAIPLGSIELIGCHGQTFFHEGERTAFLGRKISSTLQLGEASVIAERTGIPVVSDFRTRDMAAGGKGAPLVPFVDYLLFGHPRSGRVALNIGGIANLTAIPPAAKSDRVIAFDTGPGNMVIDALVFEHTRGKRKFDRDGSIASSGRTDRALLESLLANPYYKLRFPKTAGREQYGADFLDRMKKSGFGTRDLIATATELTAATIAIGIDRLVKPRMRIDDVIVSGGGAHNRHLMARLRACLPHVRILTSEDFGISVDGKEAIAFAVLAYNTWRRRPGNLPSATGARRAVVLGKITPGATK